MLVTREDGSRPVALRGVLGLQAEELEARADIRSLLDHQEAGAQRPPDEPGATVKSAPFQESAWITEAVARRLKVKPGDRILVVGRLLEVRGLLNASRMASIQDMDGSGFLPVDFEEMRGMQQQQVEIDEAALQMRQDWVVLPADSVVVVSRQAAMRMGATLRLITLYTEDVGAATKVGDELTRILPIPVALTRSDGVFRQILGSVFQMSGWKDLLFPILLGGLVIFGTMLGSVADREKEIYTFSSLGLAPMHVASLFLAEAGVYSVIGGLAGYLLAQAWIKVLGYLAGFGLLRVPQMNYSSTNAIFTLLVVMLTVLVSAIYPAMKASRSANPGILRRWRLPAPKGDRFEIVFPFTVSEYDITGVVSFLKEHFENFGDSGLGVFMAANARLVWGGRPLAEGEGLGWVGLDAELSLAPFDLGVTQSFELRSAPSEIPGIDEVKIKLTRKSGQPKDWHRLNKVLLNDLRRQFLIWRALPHETMEIYRHRTLAEMGAAKAPRGHTRK